MRIHVVLAVLMIGCGSDDSGATTTDSGTDTDETPKLPDESCVRPGDKGNSKGVGTFCTPLGKECAGFAGAPVCLADLGQKQWMCTRVGCSTDADCGTDATCYKDPGGSACVPNRCLDKSDAGADATSDAASDAPAEASTDAVSDGG